MTTVTLALHYALIGIGATIMMDIWAIILRIFLGIPSLDYALVGRWVLHMPKGRWFHKTIFQTTPMAGEHALGWFLHYAIGIAFALVFGAAAGTRWLTNPELPAALLFGLLTVLVPFLVMQPGFGFGIAASKTPAPKTARIKSLLTHLIFGLGIWLSALILGIFAG